MIVFGRNESPLLGNGWHERETDQRVGFSYRSTMKSAGIKISLQPETCYVMLLMCAPVGLLGKPQAGALALKGHEYSTTIKRAHDRWSIEVLECENVSEKSEILELEITASNIAIPDHVLHNGDHRQFGWMISAIWQRASLPD